MHMSCWGMIPVLSSWLLGDRCTWMLSRTALLLLCCVWLLDCHIPNIYPIPPSCIIRVVNILAESCVGTVNGVHLGACHFYSLALPHHNTAYSPDNVSVIHKNKIFSTIFVSVY